MMRVPKGSRWENRLVEVKSGVNVVLKCECDGLSRRVKKRLERRMVPGNAGCPRKDAENSIQSPENEVA